jgi:hypothetical protein
MKMNILIFSICFGSLSHGATLIFTATMDGAQEAPPVVTGGTGMATLTVDDVSGAWTLTGMYSSMTGTVTVSHIHQGAVGVSGGVTSGGTLSNTAGMSGTLSGTGTFSVAQLSSLQSGLFYVNVHSTVAPGGEIRGQLGLVPEPSVVLLGGLGGLCLLRRRRA